MAREARHFVEAVFIGFLLICQTLGWSNSNNIVIMLGPKSRCIDPSLAARRERKYDVTSSEDVSVLTKNVTPKKQLPKIIRCRKLPEPLV